MAGIFSRFIFNNAIFNTGNDSPDAPTSRGGVADYRAYRKQLQKIAKAADRRLYRKAEIKIEKLLKTAAPEVKAEIIAVQRQIDFGALAQAESAELHLLLLEAIKKLDLLVAQAILLDEDEDLILMMALS